jgi:hypothetical protein
LPAGLLLLEITTTDIAGSKRQALGSRTSNCPLPAESAFNAEWRVGLEGHCLGVQSRQPDVKFLSLPIQLCALRLDRL